MSVPPFDSWPETKLDGEFTMCKTQRLEGPFLVADVSFPNRITGVILPVDAGATTVTAGSDIPKEASINPGP